LAPGALSTYAATYIKYYFGKQIKHKILTLFKKT